MSLFLKLTKLLIVLFSILIIAIYSVSLIDWIINHNNHDYNSKDQYCSCSL
jgi:hypothetical protein